MNTPRYFALLSIFLFVGVTGCMKEKTFVYDEVACVDTPWHCALDCTVGETQEFIDNYSKNCITAFLKKKYISVSQVEYVYARQPNTSFVCGEKSGWQIVVKAPEMSSTSLKALGFH